jgi:hypothetical protein
VSVLASEWLASSNPVMHAVTAAKQSKDGTALKRCSRCKKRAYCSVECQKESYSAHATKCKADAAEAEAEKKDDGRVKGLDVFQTW